MQRTTDSASPRATREQQLDAVGRRPLLPLEAKVIGLQKTVGNAAVARLLHDPRGLRRSLARQHMDAGVPMDASVPVRANTTPPQRTVDISVISPTLPPDARFGGWLATPSHFSTLHPRNVAEMVDGVLRLLGRDGRIGRLQVGDHGGSDAPALIFGQDIVWGPTLSHFLPVFARLRGHFAPGGSMEFFHCWAGGRGRPVVEAIARAAGVPVLANTGVSHMLAPWVAWGRPVIVHPDGHAEEYPEQSGRRGRSL